jgi:cyclophilin family peptidyl-prolyl cis-trans isomerase
MGDSSRAIAGGLEAALKAARTDKANDARIAIIEAAAKLKQPLASQLLSGPTRDEDYVVRKRAAELIREAGREENSLIIQVGTVKSGHDRAYWRRIALMATSQKNPVAVLKLKKGEIRIELFATDAPMTVDNFIELARRGFYNGLSFMRVVPNFVIQGGDPRGDMNGGPDYQIRCEINLRRYGAGAVGMALSGKDTGGSQFFITHSPQPHLDGGYTVFGQVISGMDVVERIARDDRVESVQIIGN